MQILGKVGLVGYFSFRNGQEAVNDLASQLRGELTSRIEEKLRIYTETPNVINRLNSSAFDQGTIDVDNGKGEDKFWQQINIFPSTSLIYCGSELSGAVFGVGRLAGKNSLRTWESNPSTNNIPQFYRLDAKGNRAQLARKDTRKFDSRQRPWYKAAVAAGRATWSEVYLDFTTQLPTVTASIPIYNTDRSLKGVCATDLFLPQEMSQFLASLKIGKTGSAFIMERSGILVSTSTKEPMTVGSGANAKRLPAVESKNITVRSTANYLRDRFGNFTTIQSPQQLDFSIDGKRQFVQVLPFKDRYGLDWSIVIVIPEADFMERIDVNTRTTILLCIASSLLGVAFCILTARWITRPLVSLSQSAKALARGEWGQTVKISRSGDLGELATSFNSIAIAAFTDITERKQAERLLGNYNQMLEQQVADRTRELEREIIDRKRAEEAAQAASIAKSAFLAHMSHELRTPLNIILGFTELMILQGSLTPQQQEYLETIARSGKHLLTLINDLLEVSKLEAGKTTLNTNNFDLHRLPQFTNLSQEQSSMSLEEIRECIAQMPGEWVEQLRQAATQVNGKQIKQLSQQLSQSNPRLANALIELADNFCFEEIVTLI